MNILMVGCGAASFEIRGKQLGAAMGARVRKATTPTDLQWADVVVLIKWAGWLEADAVHQAGKPLVWDALDFWRQPDFNACSESEARALLQGTLAKIKPTLTIGATQAMAEACGGAYLPHHARPGLTPKPVRESVTTVAYEGIPKYLGRWANAVLAECNRRGWHFVINPPDLSEADIIVAFRDGPYDGWMCRNWKSGVKYVNAISVGRPIVTQLSSAWAEVQPAGVAIDMPSELSAAFDQWEFGIRRERVFPSKQFSLEQIAMQYSSILERVA